MPAAAALFRAGGRRRRFVELNPRWENELFVFGVGGLLWIILVVLLVLLVIGVLRGRG